MKTKTHFAFPGGHLERPGDCIIEHIAGVDDFQVAEAIYRAAIARWPTVASWMLPRLTFSFTGRSAGFSPFRMPAV
jgi:hypothetical protein